MGKQQEKMELVMNEMIKVGERPLINVLIKLFNKVLTCGIYPMEWGEGIITSIFKGGCVDETNNYRGITITSCLGKLFNSIMNCRLDSFTKENRLGCKEQIAYEKGARTTDHIFVLQTLTQKYLSVNKKIFACFVDMKEAFDSVLHNAILYKLFKANINGNFLKIKHLHGYTHVHSSAHRNTISWKLITKRTQSRLKTCEVVQISVEVTMMCLL